MNIFISGIGTNIGKTLVSAIVTEALAADYWKPVQAGFAEGTDADLVRALLTNKASVVHDELYRLHTPASPHIAARKDGIGIKAETILQTAQYLGGLAGNKHLVIEGAGGILVPLSHELMVADLVGGLRAKLILVSRNYLGSINHSLLTAAYCKSRNMDVLGWIFTDDYLSYEDEIVGWSGYPSLGSIPSMPAIDKAAVKQQALLLENVLRDKLSNRS